jgi:hypothetical protein
MVERIPGYCGPTMIYDRKRLLCADSVAKVFLSRRAKIYGAAAAFRAATFNFLLPMNYSYDLLI